MLLPILLAAAVAAPLPAQGDGVTLMANVDAYSGYNDVWGYTAPDGREYAILGTQGGTAFYDCSTPSAPSLVGFVPGPSSTWRDMKTFGDHCYVVTEGGGGMQIISLVNPDNPVLVTTWGQGIWSHAHNIAIDEGAGVAYVCGADTGMPVVDLSNPTSPSLITTYTATYVHDAHVQGGLAHLSQLSRGEYGIVDVGNLPSMPQLDAVQTPGDFTHNTWADATNTLCAATDEVPDGDVAFYDVSNPADIRFLSQYSVPGATVHNATIHGDRAYMSWYTAGLVVLDVSNPASPQFVGSYDTTAATGTGFDGAWGVYPFTGNGMVYVSDISNGLFVLRVDGQALEIQHTPLADTQDENGPYVVSADVVPLQGNAVASAEVIYSVDGAPEQTVPLSNTAGNTWEGGIPGQASPAVVEYRIEATDHQGVGERDPEAGTYSFHVGVLTPIAFNDFEGPTDEGWTHGQIATQDDWQRGAPQGKAGDPSSAFSGTKAWANDLGNSGWNGEYASNVHNWLQSPPIDCSGRTGVRLRFARWLTVEESRYDQARILVNGQQAWVNPFSGHVQDGAWTTFELDVSQWADNDPGVVVRFEMESDGGLEFGGWNIDDFELFALEEVPDVDTIALTGPTSANAGDQLTYSMSNLPASSPWWFLVSTSNAGTVFQGHSFDVGQPVQVLGSGTSGAAGTDSFTLTVPANASGLTGYLEVAAQDAQGGWADSNLATLTIL